MSTLTNQERQALDELFLSLTNKQQIVSKRDIKDQINKLILLFKRNISRKRFYKSHFFMQKNKKNSLKSPKLGQYKNNLSK